MMVNLSDQQIEFVLGLEDKTGHIDAHDVTEAARPRTSPIHNLYEWNKDTIAERYWFETSEAIIRAATKVKWEIEDRKVKVPCYVPDPDENAPAGRYVSLTVMKREEEKAENQLEIEANRVISAIVRGKGIASQLDLLDLFVDLVCQKITNILPMVQVEKKKLPGSRRRRGDDRPQVTT